MGDLAFDVIRNEGRRGSTTASSLLEMSLPGVQGTRKGDMVRPLANGQGRSIFNLHMLFIEVDDASHESVSLRECLPRND